MNLTGKGTLGLKQPKPERGTAKARAYMARVKQLPCVICLKPGPSDVHHVICDRYGQSKAGDMETIPLCKAHHQQGPEAIHTNKAAWVEKHGPDYAYIQTVWRWLNVI